MVLGLIWLHLGCIILGLYNTLTGTSQAAPAVTGALVILFKRHPEWMDEPDKAIKRLKDAAHSHQPFSGVVFGLGAGRIDLFEAVFNGDFELKNRDMEIGIAEWSFEETGDHRCYQPTELFGIGPQSGSRMLVCDNSGLEKGGSTSLSCGSGIYNILDIPEGVSQLPLSFKWKMATEEYKWQYSLE